MMNRPQTATGDILPVTSLDDLATGVDAITNTIRNRLHLNAGEWWEDEEIGFGLMDEIISGARIEADSEEIENIVTSYIEETEGVSGVTSVDIESDNAGKLSIACTVDTEEDEEGTVVEDVL